MKYAKIKNIELSKIDQYVSFGLDKLGNFMVIKVDSKYFPYGVTLSVIKTLLCEHNVVNKDNGEQLFGKLSNVLGIIKNSVGHGEIIFVVNKEKMNVELVKD